MNSKNSTLTEKSHMGINEDQEFVNKVLNQYGLEIKWLAEKLHLDYEIVRYQLREAKNYRQDFHQRVIEIFRKEGLISSNREVCEKLKDELIDFSQVLTGTVSIISKSIKEKIADKHLSEQEKKVLKDQLRTHLNRISDEFNDLILTIELR